MDDRIDCGEIRVYAIGMVNGLEVTVIYTNVSETERRKKRFEEFRGNEDGYPDRSEASPASRQISSRMICSVAVFK